MDTELIKIKAAVDALPDLTKEEAARDKLTLCQDRLESYRKAKRASEHANKVSKSAAEALAAYSNSVTHVLESIYTAVESDFSTFYKLIHHEDEDEFVGKERESCTSSLPKRPNPMIGMRSVTSEKEMDAAFDAEPTDPVERGNVLSTYRGAKEKYPDLYARAPQWAKDALKAEESRDGPSPHRGGMKSLAHTTS